MRSETPFRVVGGALKGIARHQVRLQQAAGPEEVTLQAEGFHAGGVGLEHEIDEVTGERQVAGGLEVAGAGEESVGAGQPDNFGGLVSGGRWEEIGRVAVVPATVLPPDGVDDELRVPVNGLKVGLVNEIGRRLDFAQDLLDPLAAVHAVDDLAGD